MRPQKMIAAVPAARLAAGRLQQFTGAYLAEDVRAIGALTSPSTMFRKDYGRETQ